MLISLLFFFYFFSLVLFSLIRHPVYYCGLLVFNSLLCSFICYLIFGFRWYSLLFCLVYIGGVYILFVFVSVFNPNKRIISYFKFEHFIIYVLLVGACIIGSLLIFLCLNIEFSQYLCTNAEGKFYVCMCLTLLLGFIILSMVMSIKLNYYR